jgi:hypothetical protein
LGLREDGAGLGCLRPGDIQGKKRAGTTQAFDFFPTMEPPAIPWVILVDKNPGTAFHK